MHHLRFNHILVKKLFALPDNASQPLSRYDVFRLKNWMLAGNYLVNVIAFALMKNLIFRGGPLPSTESMQMAASMGSMFRWGAILAIGSFIIYERPIRQFLNDMYNHRSTAQAVMETAKRRLLNEPFYLMTLNMVIWIVAAFFFSCLHGSLGEPRPVILRLFLLSLNTGLITAVMSFLLLEHVSHGHVARFFFPEGGLYKTPKTIRNHIYIRFLALLFMCNTIPFLSFLQLYYLSTPELKSVADALQEIRTAILSNSLFFIILGLVVTMFVHVNFDAPIREIIQALKDIRSGNFDRKVVVRSNDEIGYTADVINEMTTELKEGDIMRQSLFLAKEVQQHLLPKNNPRFAGLDIAGHSTYCDETGGDYYDYFDIAKPGEHKICVAVGDVCDHGIPSAILMATVRAFLRQRMSRPGQLEHIVSDVNQQLSRDVEDSGRFMTLSLCEFDVDNYLIRWIRAGHDPAMVYDPDENHFYELTGLGLPLGVFEDYSYQSYTRIIKPGQIIAIGTDGIWETTNPDDQSFGKTRFKEVIRNHYDKSASEIVAHVFSTLEKFAGKKSQSDDVTLVIVKVEALETTHQMKV
jgi:sigma-B regulation protein RsbU (phosphoserine phosphatase)